MLALIGSTPGQTAGVSPFVEDLLRAIQVAPLTFTTTYMIGTLVSAALLPRASALLDTLGCRPIAIAAGLILAAGLMLIAHIDAIGGAVGPKLGAAKGVVPEGVALVLLVLAIAMMRFGGQGLLNLAAQTVILRWFRRRRGLTTGLAALVLALVGSSAPPLLNELIQEIGWRETWLAMAVIVGPVLGALIYFFWRERPEDTGLLPDGLPLLPLSAATIAPSAGSSTSGAGPSVPVRVRPADQEPAQSWRRADAMRTLGFWVPALTGTMIALIVTAVTLLIVDLGREIGLDRDTAFAAFFVPLAITTTITSVLGGVLADHVTHRAFLVPQSVALLVHLGLLGFARLGVAVVTPDQALWLFSVSAIALGFAVGTTGAVRVTTLPRFFGRDHLGAIQGVQVTGMVVGSAIGPLAFALSEDLTGSYLLAIAVTALPVAALLLLSFRVRTPV